MTTEDATLDQIARAAHATVEEHELSGCSPTPGDADYCGTHDNAAFLAERFLPELVAGRDAASVRLRDCGPDAITTVRCNIDDGRLGAALEAAEQAADGAASCVTA